MRTWTPSQTVTEILLEKSYIDVMEPEDFLRYYEEQKQNIRSVRILPPEIGQDGFGKILVVRNRPKYMMPQTSKGLG